MIDELMRPKTALGNLDQHVAGALCYVPFFLINYIAPVLFLVMEPKENRHVRFHAVQSMFYTGTWIVGIFITTFGSVLLPVLGIVLGAAVGMEDLGAIVGLILQLVCTLVLLAISFGGMLGFLALAGLTAMQKDPRIPGVAGLVDRIVGPEL